MAGTFFCKGKSPCPNMKRNDKKKLTLTLVPLKLRNIHALETNSYASMSPEVITTKMNVLLHRFHARSTQINPSRILDY